MKNLFVFLILGNAAGFTMQPSLSSRTKVLWSAMHSGDMETFERAVECAEKFGACDLDAMEQLAKELEEFNGNYFEAGDSDLSEKEIGDRQDVADILKLQSELRLRMDYLEGANLFAQDVHDMEESYPEQE